MANRRERRKALKMGNVVYMSVEDVLALPSGCAWDGCRCITNNPDAEGWSKMLLYTGKTEISILDIDPARTARDCVLCPEHARYLDEKLLIDIGGSLRHVQGRA